VQLLSDYGLSFDICINHSQMANTIELVQQCPQTVCILDHIGKPDIKAGLLNPWRDHVRQLAAMEQVVCKISGMVTEADIQNWTIDDLRPYFEHVFECFGENRVLFGGDWPVVTPAASYRRWVDALDELTTGLSDSAKRNLWSDNARRIYRLPAGGG
jgi:L-fuconolactonase